MEPADADEPYDPATMNASPDTTFTAPDDGAPPPRPAGLGLKPPQNAAKAMLGRAFVANGEAGAGGFGMKKKVFSMADLAGAVGNATGGMSPFSSVRKSKKPIKEDSQEHVDSDGIGVDSDAEDHEEPVAETLQHTAGFSLDNKRHGGMYRVQSKLEMGSQFSPIYAIRKSVSEKKVHSSLPARHLRPPCSDPTCISQLQRTVFCARSARSVPAQRPPPEYQGFSAMTSHGVPSRVGSGPYLALLSQSIVLEPCNPAQAPPPCCDAAAAAAGR